MPNKKQMPFQKKWIQYTSRTEVLSEFYTNRTKIAMNYQSSHEKQSKRSRSNLLIAVTAH